MSKQSNLGAVKIIREFLETHKPLMVVESSGGTAPFCFKADESRLATPLFDVTNVDRIRTYLFQLPKEDSRLALAVKEVEERIKKEIDSSFSSHQFAAIVKSEVIGNKNLVLEKMPLDFSNDPREPHFSFFDLSLIKDGPIDAWEEFISRLEPAPFAKEIFMAWVYSIFEAKNKGRQALIISGKGRDGKSAVNNAIRSFLGSSTQSLGGASLKNNNFLYADWLGKRLVIYPDCKNKRILSFESIHSLTGGDTVLINPKNDKPFSARIYSKLLVTMNDTPVINDEDNEISRLIYLKVSESKTKDDQGWEVRLKNQMPAFLFKSKEFYEKYVGIGQGDIKLPLDLAEFIKTNCISDESDFYEEFSMKHLEFDKSFSCKYPEFKKCFYEKFTSAREEFGLTDSTVSIGSIFDKYFRWLSENKGIKRTKSDALGRVVSGVRVKFNKT